jgi:hypothetical protein
MFDFLIEMLLVIGLAALVAIAYFCVCVVIMWKEMRDE